MSNIFVRILIAVVCFALAMALLPALIQIFGVSVEPAIVTVIRVCLAGIAFFYVLNGHRWFARGE